MDKEGILVAKNMEDWGSISEGVCIVIWMQNISDQLMCLKTRSPAGGIVWEGYGNLRR